MPDFNVNLDTSEAQTFDVEPGVYDAVVADFQPDDEGNIVRRGDKSRYVTVVYEITEAGEAQGNKVFDNLMLEGKGAGMFVDFWRKTVGEELPTGDEGGSLGLDLSMALQSPVTIQVGEREHEGRTYPNVEKVLARE